jgi:hypothetical protein
MRSIFVVVADVFIQQAFQMNKSRRRGATGVQRLNSAKHLFQRQAGSSATIMNYIGLDIHNKAISYCVKMLPARCWQKARFQ